MPRFAGAREVGGQGGRERGLDLGLAEAGEALEAGPHGHAEGEAGSIRPASAFQFMAVGDLKYRPPEYLIDGLIETETLGLLFGDPGCGKSFVGADIGLSVATGAPFHGRKVKQGAVFLIAGEVDSAALRDVLRTAVNGRDEQGAKNEQLHRVLAGKVSPTREK